MPRLKGCWRKLVLSRAHYAAASRSFSLLYAVPDPFNNASAKEQYRYAQTAEIISSRIGCTTSILEVGCGEGAQTAWLVGLADQVVGIDPSSIAVRRARRRVPGAQFEAVDFAGYLAAQQHRRSFGAGESDPPFDLLLAGEVLYYMRDVGSVIDDFSLLARTCLVTYYAGEMTRLDRAIERIPGVQCTDIEYGESRWRAAWWPTVRVGPVRVAQ